MNAGGEFQAAVTYVTPVTSQCNKNVTFAWEGRLSPKTIGIDWY